jgi:putative aldouronate transport system permease protein
MANKNKIDINKQTLWERIKKNKQLYIFLLPALLFIIIYRYGPMAGLILAFKDFSYKLGIFGSPWVGFDHFVKFFSYYRFAEIFFNTLILAVYKLVAFFPFPIILALSLNEIANPRTKKIIQTITYAPYFISLVVIVGILYQLFSPHFGIFSSIITFINGGTKTDIMSDPNNFRHLFVWTDIWQLTGYSAILYIASLSSIPPERYEAAYMDGASKFQRIIYIDIPALIPTATILLILDVGRMMNISFEKVILLQNPLNLRTSEVLTTYLYKSGILEGAFDYATAGGLFNSVINFILIISVNAIARRLGETSLW